jgi:hypothetical protein
MSNYVQYSCEKLCHTIPFGTHFLIGQINPD